MKNDSQFTMWIKLDLPEKDLWTGACCKAVPYFTFQPFSLFLWGVHSYYTMFWIGTSPSLNQCSNLNLMSRHSYYLTCYLTCLMCAVCSFSCSFLVTKILIKYVILWAKKHCYPVKRMIYKHHWLNFSGQWRRPIRIQNQHFFGIIKVV